MNLIVFVFLGVCLLLLLLAFVMTALFQISHRGGRIETKLEEED